MFSRSCADALVSTGRAAALAVALLVAQIPATPTGAQGTAPAEPLAGVIVLRPGPDPTQPSLLPGDLLRSWRRLTPASAGDVGGRLDTILDWLEVEREQLPRGGVKVTGSRPTGSFAVSLPTASGELEVGPHLKGLVEAMAQVEARVTTIPPLDAGEPLEALAARQDCARRSPECWWLALRAAQVWHQTGELDRAANAFDRATAIARTSLPPIAQATTLLSRARTLATVGRGEEAGRLLQEALPVASGVGPTSLTTASIRDALGDLAMTRSAPEEAAEHWTSAASTYEKLAPWSGRLPAIRFKLGSLCMVQRDLDCAERLFSRAAEQLERAGDNPRLRLGVLNNLGLVEQDLGRLRRADEILHRALELARTGGGESEALANTLSNLGLVAEERGDLQTAEELYHQALAVDDRISSPPQTRARTLMSLGNVANHREELALAADYYAQAGALFGDSQDTAVERALLFNKLGTLAEKQGKLEVAERHLGEALERLERLAPESPDQATALVNLSSVKRDRGELEAAAKLLERSRSILAGAAPGSTRLALSLQCLGEVALERRDLGGAERWLQQALTIRETLAPGTFDLATTLATLGRLARLRGQLPEAVALLERAVATLEQQTERVGRSEEVRGGFRAGFHPFYRDLLESLLELGRPREAFRVLERSRARAFLAILGERQLLFGDVPADLQQRRIRLAKEHEEVQASLGGLSTRDAAAEIAELQARLRRLEEERRRVDDEIRTASPRLGALRAPSPLGVEEVVSALGPRTALLAYSLGESSSHLFVLSDRAGLQVFDLELGEKEAAQRVKLFRRTIEAGLPASTDGSQVELQGRQLYDALLRPAETALAGCDTLVVVPDGPLHTLPFAALVRTREGTPEERPSGSRDWEYLVEAKRLVFALSGTTYAEQSRGRAQPLAGTDREPVVAVGDPLYRLAAGDVAPPSASTVDYQAALARGLTLDPLPGTRREVAAVRAAFVKTTQALVGDAATESNVRAAAPTARLLHLACHALLEPLLPLDSGLALALPKDPTSRGDNGLLQAWEILEGVRLDAQLVVLSACRTGLGETVSGEGLIGLIRAFQFAGARSVLASLWEAPGEETGQLMARFYALLGAGAAPAEALQRAQTEMIRGEETSPGGEVAPLADPRGWAGFQLCGGAR